MAALREAIVTRRLVPGTRLTEENLAREYGVSRVPVREALRSLEAEGFVRIAPYSGTFVAELTEHEAEDLLRVRASLEVLCARQAAERRTEEHLDALRATIELASASIAAGHHQDLVGLNGRFHLLLAEASGNTVLHHLLTELRTKIEWVYAADVKRRAEASWTEHAWMVDALRAHDAEAAAAVATLHIANATAAYRR
jgi:DNA-binding GntR family transcriptional regulator